MPTEAEKRKALLIESVYTNNLTTGELIAHFEKESEADVRQALVSLIGSDPIRIETAIILCETSYRYEKLSERFTDVFLKNLNQLSKKDAFRLYAMFPRLLTPHKVLPDCEKEADELKKSGFFYTGVGLWLLNWQKGGKYSALLKNLGLEDEEKRAWVSRFRYLLCDYMATHDQHPYMKDLSPAAMWLLIEISICRCRLADRYKEGSKRKRYERMQSIYARLDSSDPSDKLPDRKPQDVEDLVENFWGFFMYRAKKMADEKPDFDSVLFTQYLKAEKVWGRKAREQQGAIAYL